jgi:hypothetical protein
MTASIIRLEDAAAYALLSSEHLATLPDIDQETMHRAIMNSTRMWLGEDDGKIIAMWGLIPPTLLSDEAYLWLFTTKHLQSHVFMFIRHSQRAMKEMLREYPIIVGHAKLDALRSRQWLRWLGAEFGDPVGNNIIPFTIKASQWQQDSVQSA